MRPSSPCAAVFAVVEDGVFFGAATVVVAEASSPFGRTNFTDLAPRCTSATATPQFSGAWSIARLKVSLPREASSSFRETLPLPDSSVAPSTVPSALTKLASRTRPPSAVTTSTSSSTTSASR